MSAREPRQKPPSHANADCRQANEMACARVCSKTQGEPAEGVPRPGGNRGVLHAWGPAGPCEPIDFFSKHLVRQEIRPGDSLCSGSLRPFSLEGDEPSSVGTRSAASRSGYLTGPPSHDVPTCPCFNLPGLVSPAKLRIWSRAALSPPFLSPPTCFYVLVTVHGCQKAKLGGWLCIRRGRSSLGQTERSQFDLEYGHCFFKVDCLVLILPGQALVTERQDGAIQGWCHEAFKEWNLDVLRTGVLGAVHAMLFRNRRVIGRAAAAGQDRI